MRTMKRSLALAASAVAVAGITFAGVAPATAAPAKTAAAKGRNCDKYRVEADRHETLSRKYTTLIDLEKRKAHPDMRKIVQYGALADNEHHGFEVLMKQYDKCRKG
ncbi:hypothetical protein [Streptomyces sp. NPDC020742]|uniref:hypothetical protein n=1 Tax=unclassified Streptomyces TaxID=2593676 RepID=UPI0033E3963C